MTALDVGNCPDLTMLNCSNNYIKSKDDVTGRNDKLSNFYFGLQNSGNIDDADTENITEFFTDSNFQTAVRETLGLESGADITRSACAEIKELNVSGKNIQDFSGIEYLTGLESLDCSSNRLTELECTYNNMKSQDDIIGDTSNITNFRFDPQNNSTPVNPTPDNPAPSVPGTVVTPPVQTPSPEPTDSPTQVPKKAQKMTVKPKTHGLAGIFRYLIYNGGT